LDISNRRGDAHLSWNFRYSYEIAAAESLRFSVALIPRSRIRNTSSGVLKQGRIPLDPAPEFNANVIDRSERIVGMMGTDPFCGAWMRSRRCPGGLASDTAIFAGLPFPPWLRPLGCYDNASRFWNRLMPRSESQTPDS
jgi:hypothetical protein